MSKRIKSHKLSSKEVSEAYSAAFAMRRAQKAGVKASSQPTHPRYGDGTGIVQGEVELRYGERVAVRGKPT